MSGCNDVNGTPIAVTNSQLSRLMEAGESNPTLQSLYEAQPNGSGHQLTTRVCRVTAGPFENAIITDSNRQIVGTYDNGALNWGSFNPTGRNVSFFGEEINMATTALGRSMVVLSGQQWTPEAAATIRGILGTEIGNDPQQRVYFDATTGAMAINIDMLLPTRDLIRHLNDADADDLPGISEEQREYLVDALSAEFRAKHHQEPIEETFWDQMGNYAVEITLGIGSLLGVSAAFGIAVPWFTRWFGPPNGGGHGNPVTGHRPQGPVEPTDGPDDNDDDPDNPTGGGRVSQPQEQPDSSPDTNVQRRIVETPRFEVPWYEEYQEEIIGGAIAVGVVALAASAVLVADDATGVGVADDPALLVTVPVTVGAFGIAMLAGASWDDVTGAVGDAADDVI